MTSPDNTAGLTRAYSEEAWRLYDLLDVSLSPRALDALYDYAAPHLGPGSVVLDAGCRDAKHLIELVQRFGVTGAGVDAVPWHIERAHEAVAAAALNERIEVSVGLLQELSYPDAHFDFVWCRDVLEGVAALDDALRELHRVLRPGGSLLVYTVFATHRMSAGETELMDRSLGIVLANLVEENMEAAFGRAGLAIQLKEAIGTEWREHAEEHGGSVSTALQRLSRLRRQRPKLVEGFGAELVDHVEAALHWEPFLLLGKLQPTVYVLGR